MRQQALLEADREISRLIGLGMGLFAIAEAYSVPVRRLGTDAQLDIDINYQELPRYLKGQPGVLTLGYLRDALAEKVLRIWDEEKEEPAPVRAQTATVRALCDMRDKARHRHGDMSDHRVRQVAVR